MRISYYFIIIVILVSPVNAQIPEPTPVGDINGDGIVDRNDLYIIAQHWQIIGTSLNHTPSPTPTYRVSGQMPAPTNVRFEGEKVPGSSGRNQFYESVTIRWDPIPGLDVENTDSYYRIIFLSADDFGEGIPYFSLKVNQTYVTLSLNDEFPEPDAKDALQMEGLDFSIWGVLVRPGARISVSKSTPWIRFWLYPRPTPTPTPTAILTPTP